MLLLSRWARCLRTAIPIALPADLLARIRLLFGSVAVVTTLVLIPVVAFGDVSDNNAERWVAIFGLLVTAATAIRTYLHGRCGRWTDVVVAMGMFLAATGLERPELVAMALIFCLCFQALYTSTRATAAVAFAYAVIYALVAVFAVISNAAPVKPLDSAIVFASLFLAAGIVRFTVHVLVKLQHSEARFRSLVQNASDVVTVMKADGTVIYDSDAIVELLGYQPGERLGSNGFSSVHPDDAQRVAARLADVLSWPGITVREELRYGHADGSWRWLEVTATSMLDNPAVNGIVCNYRDISERRSLEEALRHQALHDSLTGLPNRQLFRDGIDEALNYQRDTGGMAAVFFLDLDEFKNVNDGMSHSAGDAVLLAVAMRITAAIGQADIAARLGGDEFGILVNGVADADQAYLIAERLRTAVGNPLHVDGRMLSVSASVGAVMGSVEYSADEVLHRADLAMHEAKRQGKGRVQAYQPGLQHNVARRLVLRAELEQAIERSEFESHYQPIVELTSGRVVGVEALVRWRHPERGLLSPAEFIGLAEETGQIAPMGQQILNQSCRDLASWQQLPWVPDNLYVSVNVSPRQLQQSTFVDDVEDILTIAGLKPSQLMLELTETTLVQDADTAAATLGKLRSLGVSVALDDFGTGYSSLTHLRRFPVSTIKIDRSFVAAVLRECCDRAVVAAVVALAKALGISIIAEGIETASHAEALVGMGCILGQGYHFARPVPAGELHDLLMSFNASWQGHRSSMGRAAAMVGTGMVQH